MKLNKKISIVFGFIFITAVALVLGKIFFSMADPFTLPELKISKVPIELSDDTKTFVSQNGSFSVELPSNMIMIEKPEWYEEDIPEITRGEVLFIIGEYEEEKHAIGFVVPYAKPSFDGKGGACVCGDDREGCVDGFVREVVAGQEVQVCKLELKKGFFSAQYFTHPKKNIEYAISANFPGYELGEIEKVTQLFNETLQFID